MDRLKAKVFNFDKSQIFYKKLGGKQALLQRALMQKNIKIDIYPEEGEKSAYLRRWVAKGKNKAIVFRGTMPSSTSLKANEISKNKTETKSLLHSFGLRVPKGIVVSRSEFDNALQWFDSIDRKKVVVKPIYGSGGNGVFSNITEKSCLESIIKEMGEREFIVEEHIEGDDHRILVVGGKFVAAMRRWPANVIGDGFSTIDDLVKKKNAIRAQNPYDSRYPIKVTCDVERRLGNIGLTPDSVIEKGRRVFLQTIANIGVGGEGEDVTDIIHQEFVDEVEKCCEAFPDLECFGVDLIAEDISKPPSVQDYSIIEVNANCDIPIHHWPTLGQPLDVAAVIADHYFPDEEKDISYAVEVVVGGEVQGVGFRKWLSRQAVIHGLTGYCMNGNDEDLLALFEGSKYSVDSLISLCGKGPRKSNVETIEFKEIPSEGRTTFMIF